MQDAQCPRGLNRRTAQSLTAFETSTASHVSPHHGQLHQGLFPPLFSPLQFLTYLAEKEKLADENVGPGNCRLHGLGGKMNRKETECGVYKTARSGA